jgi:nucleotide-binding universal stress UspA family protein
VHIVVGVDWSNEAFTAVQVATRLYTPEELTLVHALDLGFLAHPAVAQAMELRGHDEFLRAMEDSAQQLLDQTSALVPADVTSVKRVCKKGSAAAVVLDTAKSVAADLLVVGSRGMGRIAEFTLGSVSHRVLTHAVCSTLIVKRPLDTLRKVLLAVEGPEDAARLQGWLLKHPFKQPVELLVISVVPDPQFGDPPIILAFAHWEEAVWKSAQEVVDGMVAKLNGAHYKVAGQVFKGEPAGMIAREAASCDLLVVSFHARGALDRFLLGSVSHSVTHRVACPVLVVRP